MLSVEFQIYFLYWMNLHQGSYQSSGTNCIFFCSYYYKTLLVLKIGPLCFGFRKSFAKMLPKILMTVAWTTFMESSRYPLTAAFKRRKEENLEPYLCGRGWDNVVLPYRGSHSCTNMAVGLLQTVDVLWHMVDSSSQLTVNFHIKLCSHALPRKNLWMTSQW